MTPVEMRAQADLMRRHGVAADDPELKAQYFKLAADADELARKPGRRQPAPRRS